MENWGSSLKSQLEKNKTLYKSAWTQKKFLYFFFCFTHLVFLSYIKYVDINLIWYEGSGIGDLILRPFSLSSLLAISRLGLDLLHLHYFLKEMVFSSLRNKKLKLVVMFGPRKILKNSTFSNEIVSVLVSFLNYIEVGK